MKKLYILILSVGSLLSVDPAVEFSVIRQLDSIQRRVVAMAERNANFSTSIDALSQLINDLRDSVQVDRDMTNSLYQRLNYLNQLVDAFGLQIKSLGSLVQSESVVSDFMKERIALAEKRLCLLEDSSAESSSTHFNNIQKVEDSFRASLDNLSSEVSKIKSRQNKILRSLKKNISVVRRKKFKPSLATELSAQNTRAFKSEYFDASLVASRFKNS